jgi:hypothetical protein
MALLGSRDEIHHFVQRNPRAGHFVGLLRLTDQYAALGISWFVPAMNLNICVILSIIAWNAPLQFDAIVVVIIQL